jgi:hypothetical protein
MPTVESQAPYSSPLYWWLHLHQVPLDNIVQQSRRYERAYLAWETVRQVRNPFFTTGTGFEGYFVGIYHSPDEMFAHLLEIGHQMLESNSRLYRYQYGFQATLMKTIRGELSDLLAMDVWSALLGAALSRLRCNVYYHDETYRFQNETYWAVNRLPFIKYRLGDRHIEQEYVLPRFQNNGFVKQEFDLNMLKPSDYDAGLVVSAIGRFGHPLIRAYLREITHVAGHMPSVA